LSALVHAGDRYEIKPSTKKEIYGQWCLDTEVISKGDGVSSLAQESFSEYVWQPDNICWHESLQPLQLRAARSQNPGAWLHVRAGAWGETKLGQVAHLGIGWHQSAGGMSLAMVYGGCLSRAALLMRYHRREYPDNQLVGPGSGQLIRKAGHIGILAEGIGQSEVRKALG
jgi:hypothetical protein